MIKVLFLVMECVGGVVGGYWLGNGEWNAAAAFYAMAIFFHLEGRRS